MPDFTDEQKTEISHAFDDGNYDHAYVSESLRDEVDLDGMPEHERAAYVLGFFSSLTLEEIGSDRDLFDECYWSPAGRYVVEVARYCDDRSDEYAAEQGASNA